MSRIFTMSFASVYRLYIAKVEKKGRTQAELDEVIRWLSGYDEATLEAHITSGTNFQDFFAQAKLHPKVSRPSDFCQPDPTELYHIHAESCRR